MFKHFLCHAKMDEPVKVTGDAPRRIKGYASTKDIDRVRDIVEPSAFKETIDVFMKNPLLCFNHNWNEGLGKVLSVTIDENGLFVECEIAKGTPLADQVWTLIEQGVYRAFSFGFKILADRDVEEDASTFARRVITKLDLLEVSVVTVPANANATFSLAKSLEWGTDMFPITPQEQLVAAATSIQAKLQETLTSLKAAPVVEAVVEPEVDEKGCPKFMDLDLADEGLPWDKSKAMRMMREFASSDGSGDKSKMDWAKFAQGFFWFDDNNSDNFEGYKLPFCFVEEGKLLAVPRGVFAAAAATRGARGGVRLPEADTAKVQSNIEKYYKKMGRPSPYEKRSFDIDLEEFIQEVPDEKKFDASWMLMINQLMGFKNALGAVDAHHQELKALIDSLSAMRETPTTEPPTQSDDGKGAAPEEGQAAETTTVAPAKADEVLSEKMSLILEGLKEVERLLPQNTHR